MAAAWQIHRAEPSKDSWRDYSAKVLELPEFAGVFRGRELTRKDRRLCSGLYPIDGLIGGGIVRGRVSEITGVMGSGKTSLAASFIATATRRGEVAAWIDSATSSTPKVSLRPTWQESCGYPVENSALAARLRRAIESARGVVNLSRLWLQQNLKPRNGSWRPAV